MVTIEERVAALEAQVRRLEQESVELRAFVDAGDDMGELPKPDLAYRFDKMHRAVAEHLPRELQAERPFNKYGTYEKVIQAIYEAELRGARKGAEAMRERAATFMESDGVPGRMSELHAEDRAARIRALPVDKDGE